MAGQGGDLTSASGSVNAHAVENSVLPIDYTDGNGSPTVKTYHGACIVVNNAVVGRIQSWEPENYTREGTHVYELNCNTWGHPVDYVPGKSTGFTIALSRLEVWNSEYEIAMNLIQDTNSAWASLAEQTAPWTIDEYLFKGKQTSPYKQWKYTGCWLQNRNESAWTAEDDAKITVTSTIAYINRTKVNG